jgi:hypothetical protein
MRILDDRASSIIALPTDLLPAETDIWSLGTLREGLEDAIGCQQAVLPRLSSKTRLSLNHNNQETAEKIFDTDVEYFNNSGDNFSNSFEDSEIIPLNNIKVGPISKAIDLFLLLSQATTRS